MRRLLLLAPLLATGCPIPDFRYPPGPPRILRFAASPLEIGPGEEVQLTWDVEEAQAVELLTWPTAQGAPPLDARGEPLDASGSRALRLDASSTFELLATGPGGQRRARAAALVFDPAEVSIVRLWATPASALLGDRVTVSWQVAHAHQVRLEERAEGLLFAGPRTEGSVDLRPTRPLDLLLVAEGRGGPRQARLQVPVRERPPRVVMLLLEPPIITPSGQSRVRLAVEGATELRLEAEHQGDSRLLYDGPAQAGVTSFGIDGQRGSAIVRARARNSGGEVTESARLVVLAEPEPRVLALSATPPMNGPGGTTVVRWATRDGAATLGFAGDPPLSLAAAGEQVVLVPLSPSELHLTVRAPSRTATATLPLGVDLALPTVWMDSPLGALVPGALVGLAWQAARADRVRISTDSGLLLATSTLAAGRVDVIADRPMLLLLEAENQHGTSVLHRFIDVDVRPFAESFTLSHTTARAGRPLEVEWRTHGALRGTLGETAGLREPLSPSPASGRRVLHPQLEGEVSITLHLESRTQSVDLTAPLLVLPRHLDTQHEEEPNDDLSSAGGPFAAPVTLSGAVLTPFDVDVFTFELPVGFRPTVAMTDAVGCETLIQLGLYEERLGRWPALRFVSNQPCPQLAPSTQPELALLGPALSVAIHQPGPEDTLSYNLTVGLEPVACPDGVVDRGEECDDGNGQVRDGCSPTCRLEGLDEQEPNDDGTNATPVPFAAVVRAFLLEDEVDFFRFDLPASSEGPTLIALESTSGQPCALDARLSLYAANGVLLAVDDGGGFGCPRLDGPPMVLPAGRYLLRVEANDGDLLDRGRGPYVLQLSPL